MITVEPGVYTQKSFHDDLTDKLSGELGTYRLLNGQEVPSLWVGPPPAGTDFAVRKLEVIIAPRPTLTPYPFLDSHAGLEAWQITLRQLADWPATTELASLVIFNSYPYVQNGSYIAATEKVEEQQILYVAQPVFYLAKE